MRIASAPHRSRRPLWFSVRAARTRLLVASAVAVLVASLIYLGAGTRRHVVSASAPARPALTGLPKPLAAPTIEPAAAAAPANVYDATRALTVGSSLAPYPERVYVPDSTSATVEVIDPATFAVVGHFSVGRTPYHITPSWDMKTLYVGNEASGSLTAIDPITSTPIATIPVPHPYNMYFTPDGTTTIVVAEREGRLVLMDRVSWAVQGSIRIPWPGVDHMDFSADGTYALASSEFAGMVAKIDLANRQVVGAVKVGGLPIDVRLSPDGSVFYVANQGRGGVSVVDPVAMTETAFIPTGRGAHGFQLSRDTSRLYVSNRLEGSISVIDLATRQVAAKWHTGGSPDMLQLSPDGLQLWASGRFDKAVYVINTSTGALLKTIHVGSQPHGLTFFPNVGRFSIGHNGVYR
jgi:YVTN family beta-propeller protein